MRRAVTFAAPFIACALLGLFTAGLGCDRATTVPPAAAASSSYAWGREMERGGGCWPGRCAEGQWPLAVRPVAGPGGKLWMVGDREVWSSADGRNWSRRPSNAGWGVRHGATVTYFDGKLWLMGGMRAWDDFRNDVWFSEDGADWRLATPRAAWSPRRGHQTLVHGGRLWVFGGGESSGRPDQTPTRFLSDVWSSHDGRAWTLVTNDAPWPAREAQYFLVFKGELWAIGGRGRAWHSPDGHVWTEVKTDAAIGERHGGAAAVLDGRMWVYGGAGRNDVWSSEDGAHWRLNDAQAPWSTRATFNSVVFKERLWIYGGKTGRPEGHADDVWAMSLRRE